jgi:hypothetical protein
VIGVGASEANLIELTMATVENPFEMLPFERKLAVGGQTGFLVAASLLLGKDDSCWCRWHMPTFSTGENGMRKSVAIPLGSDKKDCFKRGLTNGLFVASEGSRSSGRVHEKPGDILHSPSREDPPG